jgi:hypothetical protein
VTLALVIDGSQLVGLVILGFVAGWLAAESLLPTGAADEGGDDDRRPHAHSWDRKPW